LGLPRVNAQAWRSRCATLQDQTTSSSSRFPNRCRWSATT
jgi:hypothetical protein